MPSLICFRGPRGTDIQPRILILMIVMMTMMMIMITCTYSMWHLFGTSCTCPVHKFGLTNFVSYGETFSDPRVRLPTEATDESHRAGTHTTRVGGSRSRDRSTSHHCRILGSTSKRSTPLPRFSFQDRGRRSNPLPTASRVMFFISLLAYTAPACIDGHTARSCKHLVNRP